MNMASHGGGPRDLRGRPLRDLRLIDYERPLLEAALR